RKVPDAYLLVVGEGSKRSELEQQARDLRIAHRVVFTGRRDDVPAVTAALDVAVLPSYREAQGLTILGAMALSRPVVGSTVCASAWSVPRSTSSPPSSSPSACWPSRHGSRASLPMPTGRREAGTRTPPPRQGASVPTSTRRPLPSSSRRSSSCRGPSSA